MQNPMMQLRKIVNHPYLVKWQVDPETGIIVFFIYTEVHAYIKP